MTSTKTTASTRRESWGSLRKLASGRWQARYPGPDGNTYTVRTDDDKPLTFYAKTTEAAQFDEALPVIEEAIEQVDSPRTHRGESLSGTV